MKREAAKGRTILIVDDEAHFREALGEGLQEEGYEVVTAGRSDEALRLLDERSVDVALLDLRLGVESGMDLLQQVRSQSPATVPIMITGVGDIADFVEDETGVRDAYLLRHRLDDAMRAAECARFLDATGAPA